MKKISWHLPILLIALFLSSCGGGGGSGAIPVSGTGSAALGWSAPTTNADGSPLTDLAGFKVHYGTSPGVYSKTIDVGNVTTFEVTNLELGNTYYFAVTAYNKDGVESDPSKEASKAIP